ncbi:hypothetical protein ACOSQ3_028999 [Xanthoceras sorbifolium]
MESQKVYLASYHLEGEANQWWRWLQQLWARFGPTDCEDFDEALLGNRVHGWTQKALVGTFMGGLKVDIADCIRMFKPKSLKEAISLAYMNDEQLTRHRKFIRPFNQSNTEVPLFEGSNDKLRRTTRVSIKIQSTWIDKLLIRKRKYIFLKDVCFDGTGYNAGIKRGGYHTHHFLCVATGCCNLSKKNFEQIYLYIE